MGTSGKEIMKGDRVGRHYNGSISISVQSVHPAFLLLYNLSHQGRQLRVVQNGNHKGRQAWETRL